MRELTNDDLDELVDGSVFGDWRGYAREVIAADRALNAPVGSQVAWLLTDENINDLQIESVQRLIDRARLAHFTDLIIRINGKDERYEVDWLKHLVRATPPLNAPADRDVMRDMVNALLHQIDIGDFVDSHGHSAKMLKPVHDLMRLLSVPTPPTEQGERQAQEGWKWVPIEPTKRMDEAAYQAEKTGGVRGYPDLYRAMIDKMERKI